MFVEFTTKKISELLKSFNDDINSSENTEKQPDSKIKDIILYVDKNIEVDSDVSQEDIK